MGHLNTIVDSSPPAAITAAIMKVQRTPELASRHGMDALWLICRAPGHQMLEDELSEKIGGGLTLHFGWLCRRVAEELGDPDPDAFALVDYKSDETGRRILSVKPSVLAAMPRRAREAGNE